MKAFVCALCLVGVSWETGLFGDHRGRTGELALATIVPIVPRLHKHKQKITLHQAGYQNIKKK